MAFLRITNHKALRLMANSLRQSVISMLTLAKSGHSAGSLGMADVFTALYFNVLTHKPELPDWHGRDRVILSNGHICPILYSTLAECGYFPKEELKTLRQINSRLQGHPHHGSVPGVETSGGPLGQGLAVAIGTALSHLADKSSARIYCLTGDGELDEGVCWESFMLAGARRLRNLCVVIDRNNIQIDGNTEEVLALEPLADKLRAFNFHVIEINGHSMSHVIEAFEEAKSVYERPTAIICHTVPGKGVSFMERDFEWHGKAPTPEQAKVALIELEHEHEAILAEK